MDCDGISSAWSSVLYRTQWVIVLISSIPGDSNYISLTPDTPLLTFTLYICPCGIIALLMKELLKALTDTAMHIHTPTIPVVSVRDACINSVCDLPNKLHWLWFFLRLVAWSSTKSQFCCLFSKRKCLTFRKCSSSYIIKCCFLVIYKLYISYKLKINC